MAIEQRGIKVLSVAAPETDKFDDPKHLAKVVFGLGEDLPEFFVLLSRRQVSDENLIRVARHYLHVQMQALAEATASWRLSDAEYQKLVPPKTPPQNINPVQIPH